VATQTGKMMVTSLTNNYYVDKRKEEVKIRTSVRQKPPQARSSRERSNEAKKNLQLLS